MTNDEIQMTNECRSTNDELSTRLPSLAASSFAFVIRDFVLRLPPDP